jgi:hypothetical protein
MEQEEVVLPVLFTIIRVAVEPEGAFGVLKERTLPFAVTLERTYEPDSVAVTKIPDGIYECVRTTYHRGGYVTYEIKVPGHSRILFHRGNWETDSDGCTLVGESFAELLGKPAIADSRGGFSEFMERAAGRDRFNIRVVTCSNS